MIYFIIFALICSFYCLSNKGISGIYSKYFSFLALLSITFLSAFRYQVGTDYENYIYLAELIIGGYGDSEPAFTFLVEGVDYFDLPIWLIFPITSVIICYGYFAFFNKFYDKKLVLSLLLFYSIGIYFFASMNLIRQFVSVSLFLISLTHLVEKRYFNYSLFMGLSILFHYSAIILLPITFFIRKEYSLIKYLTIFLIYIISLKFLDIVIKLTPYSIYLTREFSYSANKYFAALFMIASLFSFFYLKRKSRYPTAKTNVIINMLFISFLLSFSLFISPLPEIVFLRYNNFFSPAIIIFICAFIEVFKKDWERLIYNFLIIAICFAYLCNTVFLTGSENNVIPYNSILG